MSFVPDVHRLAEIVERGADWVLLADASERLLYANRAARTMLGLDPEAQLGDLRLAKGLPPAALDALRGAALPAVRAAGSWTGQSVLLAEGGREIPVSLSLFAHRSASGDIECLSFVMRDMSKVKAIEENLRRSEGRLRQAQRMSGLGIWEWDIKTDAVHWSDEVYAFYGVKPEEFTGRGSDYLEFTHPEDRERQRASIRRSFDRSASSPERTHAPDGTACDSFAVDTQEFRIVRRDGSIRWGRGDAVAIVDERGEPNAMLGTIIDVTERKELEAQLRQAQKMESIGTLAGGVAHDFNNLLTTINGYAEMALQGLPANAPLRLEIEEIRKAGDRAAKLTSQLLAFSRKQMLQPRPMDLNRAIEDISNMLRRLIGENIRLEIRADPALASVEADPGQIEHVVMNLAVNARDAMPQGGTLTISTSNIEIDREFAATHPGSRRGPHVVLRVSDTGEGMDAATMTRIFEPFFTTKARGKGTGLGLAMVYGIVKQSGGSVYVESRARHGSTFEVYLPTSAAAASHEAAAAAPPRELGSGETVLLVEDEVMVRQFSRRILESHGYGVIDVADAEAALELIRQARDPINVLLTDVILPGMTGGELAGRARETRPELKIVFVSGYAGDEIEEFREGNGDFRFLQKPFTAGALLAEVRAALEAAA